MSEIQFAVENIGGIDQLAFETRSEVILVTGPNASNKTSLLTAIAFALGYPTVPIKTDAEEGSVSLRIGDTEVARSAKATPNGRAITGDTIAPEDSRPDLVRLFACLLEFNEIRQAIRANTEFKQLLTAPVDIDALEQERSTKLEEKRAIKRDLDQLSDVDERIEATEAQIETTASPIEDLQEELTSMRERQRETASDDDELTALFEERTDLVRERNQYREQVSDLKASLTRLDERMDKIVASREEVSEEVDAHDLEALRAERREIKEQIQDAERRSNVLQSVLLANRELVESPYAGVLGEETTVLRDEYDCWTCGEPTTADRIEETLQELQALINEDRSRRNQFEPALAEIDEKIDRVNNAKRQVRVLEDERKQLAEQREHREDSLQVAQDQLSEAETALQRLDEELSTRQRKRESSVSDLTNEIEEVQSQLTVAQQELSQLRAEKDRLQAKHAERERKESRLSDVNEDIVELTQQIENTEQALREQFNAVIEELLSILAYENIDRIWLDGNFSVIISRELDGVTRRDSLEHLSESEREMVGIVLALAGYLTYDVKDSVPVLVLDALGAFDSTRTANLLTYISDQVPVLVAAASPESVQALEETELDPETISPGELVASP